MLNITFDIYSGRFNPTFTLSSQEARDILKEIALHKGVITPFDVSKVNLGYRGINISFKSHYVPHYYGLPASFSIANGLSMFESKGREIAERLLNISSISSASSLNKFALSPSLTSWIMKQMKDIPTFSYRQDKQHPPFGLKNEIRLCPFETVVFEPAVWNTPYHVTKNNCYNFATNRRTDSFAQPGRASGQIYREINCDTITRAAMADGAQKANSCIHESEKPRFLMALFIAPDLEFTDYHWYCQCSDGSWAHKLGPRPACNIDNSNYVITDPRTANRGPYIQFCGYMLAPKSMRVY